MQKGKEVVATSSPVVDKASVLTTNPPVNYGATKSNKDYGAIKQDLTPEHKKAIDNSNILEYEKQKGMRNVGLG